MIRPLVATLVLGVAVTGCASAHESHAVGSGIYDLTVRSEAGGCTASSLDGEMGPVGVVVEADVLNVPAPDGLAPSLARVSLARSAGYASEVVLPIDGCPGATLRRTWSVAETAPASFGLVFEQEWSGVEGCASIRDLMPEAPTASCRAEQLLEYRLATACAAPCEIHVAGGAPTCVCF